VRAICLDQRDAAASVAARLAVPARCLATAERQRWRARVRLIVAAPPRRLVARRLRVAPPSRRLSRLLAGRGAAASARGAEVDQTSVHGDLLIPLMLAICNSSVEMVTVLLDAGATVDVPDSHNVTPLYQSCSLYEYSNRLEKARLLLARGADINWAVGETPHSSRGEYKGETPLLAAQRRGGPIERLVDDYLILFWKRARLLALGRRGSAARCRIMNDRYLAKHLGSFLIGNDVREEDA